MSIFTNKLTFTCTQDQDAICDSCSEGAAAKQKDSAGSENPIFVLPCQCRFHLHCLSLAFKTQHALICFFNCPGCFTDLNDTGDRSRELQPPSGELLQIKTVGRHIQVAAFQDAESETITGHLVYREEFDQPTGTLTVSVALVEEKDGRERFDHIISALQQPQPGSE